MAFFTLPESAVGSVTASVVAAVVAYLGLVISKESKTSEFRQAWLDALRSDLADVVASASLLRGAKTANYKDHKEVFDTVKDIVGDFNRADASVRLRLNPSEPLCQKILDSIKKLEIASSAAKIDIEVCAKLESELLQHSQAFLKQEWHRVRRGERVFVFSKWAAGLTSLAMIILLVVTWLTSSVAATPAAESRAPNSPETTSPVIPAASTSTPISKPSARATVSSPP